MFRQTGFCRRQVDRPRWSINVGRQPSRKELGHEGPAIGNSIAQPTAAAMPANQDGFVGRYDCRSGRRFLRLPESTVQSQRSVPALHADARPGTGDQRARRSLLSWRSRPPPAAGLPPTPPPAVGPPSTVPTSTPLPADKYSPRGGFNLPQSSIDRSKATSPVAGEVKAGGTAIARLSRPKTAATRPATDGQLAAGATAAARQPPRPNHHRTADAETAAADSDRGSRLSPPATTHRSPIPDPRHAENLAFADAPATAQASAENEPDSAADDRSALVTTAGRWSSGGSGSAASTTGAGTSIRIVDPDQPSGGVTDLAMTDHAGLDGGNSGRPNLAESHDSTGTEQDLSSPPGGSAQASLIESSVPAAPAAELAMADSGVVAASWNQPASPAAATGAAPGDSQLGGRPGYGYDPAYGWLRGRLEYSASQRQWKLRYIPIDGTTDQFGGSVVLADGTQTQGLKPGDFVTAQGRVVAASQSGRDFSPRYRSGVGRTGRELIPPPPVSGPSIRPPRASRPRHLSGELGAAVPFCLAAVTAGYWPSSRPDVL